MAYYSGHHPASIPPGDKEVARLKRLLAEFEAIPADRREDELADIRAQSVRVMLKDMERKS